MTVSRDKVHEYLGMKFDFTENGVVMIDMSAYVKTIIANMPEDMVGKAPTPAANHLFKIREGHYRSKRKMVMQLQYLSQRGRPDVRTAVSFLCKRVSAPDDNDYKKLTRVMRYLQSTRNLKLKLESDGSSFDGA